MDYRDGVDFSALAREDPAFAAVYGRRSRPEGRGQHLDFQDPEAVRALTQALLRRDFGLHLELPSDRLCPPVPNRQSYVVWVARLLESVGRSSSSSSPIHGLDIGTGASCIYPLLACVQHPGWRFWATELDAASAVSAVENVRRNGLEERIVVVPRSQDDPLLLLLDQDLDFVMTNPPFYRSADEMETARNTKKRAPHAVCTGAPVEMVCEGGEVAFVQRMVEESAAAERRKDESERREENSERSEDRRSEENKKSERSEETKEKCWYTAMLGKLSSVAHIVDALRAAGVDNYAVDVLQASRTAQTTRWVVGWTWGARRPTEAVARGAASSSGVESRLLPAPTETVVWREGATGEREEGRNDKEWGDEQENSEQIKEPQNERSEDTKERRKTKKLKEATDTNERSEDHNHTRRLGDFLDKTIASLDLQWEWSHDALRGQGYTVSNVWSRAYRRQKEKGLPGLTKMKATPFGFAVTIHVGVRETTVVCRWTEGHHEPIYQSFCGFLKTKLSSWRDAALAANMEHQ